MPLVKVTGTNFVRDTRSMALINTDEMARNEYYTKAKLLKTQKDEINKEVEGLIKIRKVYRYRKVSFLF